MFHSQYQNITYWLHIHPHWGWLAAFVIAFAESVAVIGSIVPGSVTMTAIGILAGSGVLPIWSIVISAIFGAIIGDGLSYLAGYYFQDQVRAMWPFSKYPQILSKGETFFLKHGGKSVFFGRFVGPVRAIIPIVAGTLKLPPKRYFTASILSAIGWAPTYMLPGILLGAISLEMPAYIATELILFVLLLLVAIWVIVYLTKQIFRKSRRYFNSILDEKWIRWATQPSKRWICTLLRNGEHPETHGQLLISIVSLTLGILFIVMLITVIFHGPLTHWNNFVYHWLRGIRSSTADHIAIVVTSFGNKIVLLPLLGTLLIWLLIIKRWRAAIHWFLVCFLTTGAAYFVKVIYFSHRPFGILANPITSSFPSGHTALAIAFYGFIAFMLAYQRSKPVRKTIYRITFTLCLAVAISRLYLSAHWLTDIIGSITLSLAILYFIVISYRRVKTQKLPMLGIIIVTLLTLIFSDGFYLYHHFHRDLTNSQPFWKTEQIQETAWWNQTSAIIPYYRTNRFGEPIKILNVQWTGSLTQIKLTLAAHKWSSLLTRDYLSTLKGIAKEKRTLPHTIFAKLYRDQHPAIEMVKFSKTFSAPLVLRLWPAKINLLPKNQTLWVGTIYFDPTTKELFPFFHRKHYPQSPSSKNIISYLIPVLSAYQWETKPISPTKLPKRLKKAYPLATVIIIRPWKIH